MLVVAVVAPAAVWCTSHVRWQFVRVLVSSRMVAEQKVP